VLVRSRLKLGWGRLALRLEVRISTWCDRDLDLAGVVLDAAGGQGVVPEDLARGTDVAPSQPACLERFRAVPTLELRPARGRCRAVARAYLRRHDAFAIENGNGTLDVQLLTPFTDSDDERALLVSYLRVWERTGGAPVEVVDYMVRLTAEAKQSISDPVA
jgi:hypothetical protein